MLHLIYIVAIIVVAAIAYAITCLHSGDNSSRWESRYKLAVIQRDGLQRERDIAVKALEDVVEGLDVLKAQESGIRKRIEDLESFWIQRSRS